MRQADVSAVCDCDGAPSQTRRNHIGLSETLFPFLIVPCTIISEFRETNYNKIWSDRSRCNLRAIDAGICHRHSNVIQLSYREAYLVGGQ